MRRIDIVIGLIVLSIVCGTILGIKYFADPDRKLIRNEDAEVIDAALLSFFEKGSWQSPEWTAGDFIVLFQECRSDPVETFAQDLTKIASYSKANTSNRKYWPMLNNLLKQYASSKATSPRTLDLRQLRIDPRIVVSKPSPLFERGKQPQLHNRYGESGTQRAGGSLYPPLYSSDHQVAIVRASVVWSIHHADVFFLLQKSDGRWKALFAQPIYYP